MILQMKHTYQGLIQTTTLSPLNSMYIPTMNFPITSSPSNFGRTLWTATVTHCKWQWPQRIVATHWLAWDGLVKGNSCKVRQFCPGIRNFFLVVQQQTTRTDDQFFSTGATNMLTERKSGLHGKDKTMINMMSSANTFKWKMWPMCFKLQHQPWSSKIKKCSIRPEDQGKVYAQLDSARHNMSKSFKWKGWEVSATLGTYLDIHQPKLTKKAQQQLYFLMRLSKFGMSHIILGSF